VGKKERNYGHSPCSKGIFWNVKGTLLDVLGQAKCGKEKRLLGRIKGGQKIRIHKNR